MASYIVDQTLSSGLESLTIHESLAIVAGHFSLADYLEDVSNTGDAEIASFKAGVTLAKQAMNMGKRCQLFLLINDIGIEKDGRKTLKQAYKIPKNYSDIMMEDDLDEEYLTVIFESSVRNKASTTLRKLYKKNPDLFERLNSNDEELCRCVAKSACSSGNGEVNTVYVIKGPDDEKLVVKEGPNPKCNLILATFFNDICEKYTPSLIVTFFNDIYQNRIRLGIHVGKEILNVRLPFINIFCDGDKLMLLESEDHVAKNTLMNMGGALNCNNQIEGIRKSEDLNLNI